MANEERKLDTALAAAYAAWSEDPELAPDAGVSVMASFEGDVAQLEALGFETHSVFGDQALGVVYFKDLSALGAHPNVLWMAAGDAAKPDLDTAARDIRARATNPISGAPVDGLWHADVSSGALTKVPRGSGRGVIVAILDTGIDFTHPMFISQTSPTLETRILRIWDQGLTPTSISQCPEVRLLASAETYGVEYTDTDIEAHLNGGATIDHRDCNGHGTHVAGIAAGGPTFAPVFGDASKVGVAPEADIIAVKLLDVPDVINKRRPDGSVSTPVEWDARFVDAVLYCLRTARDDLDDRPIVINMSFGTSSKPGDGLDDEARWLDGVLDPAQARSDNNFPRRAVVVKTSGNDGGGGMDVLRIEVPASGEITVPFVLFDNRTGQTHWQRCSQELYKPELPIHFWYRRPAAPLSVAFAVQFPHGNPPFSADVMAGGKLDLGINPVVGPPRNDIAVAFAPDIHRITIDHRQIVQPAPHPAGGTVQRQYVRVAVGPKFSGGAVSYHTGIYEVRIKAPAQTVLYAKCEAEWWNAENAGFRLSETMRNGAPRPAGVVNLFEFSSVDPFGQHVLTVAAYNDLADSFFGTPAGAIADFSSRGPLRDYSDPPRAPAFNKPDIAAPGVRINSAESRHVEGFLRWPWWYLGDRFKELDGTSMAAPMIAGVVALCFEKNQNLNVTDVRTALSTAPRAAVEPSSAPASTNAYGAGRVDAMTTHANV